MSVTVPGRLFITAKTCGVRRDPLLSIVSGCTRSPASLNAWTRRSSAATCEVAGSYRAILPSMAVTILYDNWGCLAVEISHRINLYIWWNFLLTTSLSLPISLVFPLKVWILPPGVVDGVLFFFRLSWERRELSWTYRSHRSRRGRRSEAVAVVCLIVCVFELDNNPTRLLPGLHFQWRSISFTAIKL